MYVRVNIGYKEIPNLDQIKHITGQAVTQLPGWKLCDNFEPGIRTEDGTRDLRCLSRYFGRPVSSNARFDLGWYNDDETIPTIWLKFGAYRGIITHDELTNFATAFKEAYNRSWSHPCDTMVVVT